MKKVIFLLSFVLFGFAQETQACNKASFDVNSEVDNGDGTYTYNVDLCIEFSGMEGNPSWFNMIFSGGTFTTIDSYTPNPDPYSTSSGDIYTDALLSGDSQIRWTTGSAFIAHSGANPLCVNVIIVTNGRPGQIGGSFHDTYGGSCNYSYTLPSLPVPCSISTTLGTQSTCNPVDNTYTQNVIVTYADNPTTGTLDVNGQSFAIGTSPQTVLLTALTADGAAVNGTAVFSDDATCSAAVSFTAPPSCSVCAIDNVALGTQSTCNSSNNTYTQEVTVTFSNPPSSGTLDVNGQSFAIGSSPQTVLLTALTADGNLVNATVEFSADTACNDSTSFTAPAACSVGCAPDNGTWD